MKKDIALLLGLVLGLGFVSCSSNDDENTNGEKYIAEVAVTRYKWKSGIRSPQGTMYQLFKYNEKGQLISNEYLYEYSALYVYDDKGMRIDLVDKTSGKYEYEYNSMDRVSVMRKYDREGKLFRTHNYEYDYNNKLIKDIEYNRTVSDNIGIVRAYSYGENSDTVNATYLGNGRFYDKNIHECDSHGNVVKHSFFNTEEGNAEIVEFINEYDSIGRLQKRIGPIYRGEKDVESVEYSYNDDGTIKTLHIIIPEREEDFDLEYTYTYKNK